jgi:hypothetical protein
MTDVVSSPLPWSDPKSNPLADIQAFKQAAFDGEPLVVPADVVGMRMNMGGMRDSVLTLHCVPEPVGCGRAIPVEEINSWPAIDQKEYSMSGFCGGGEGSCQDRVFAEPEEDDEPDECTHEGKCEDLGDDFEGFCLCTCNSPCCEADVEVGIITCGSSHCRVHKYEVVIL